MYILIRIVFSALKTHEGDCRDKRHHHSLVVASPEPVSLTAGVLGNKWFVRDLCGVDEEPSQAFEVILQLSGPYMCSPVG